MLTLSRPSNIILPPGEFLTTMSCGKIPNKFWLSIACNIFSFFFCTPSQKMDVDLLPRITTATILGDCTGPKISSFLLMGWPEFWISLYVLVLQLHQPFATNTTIYRCKRPTLISPVVSDLWSGHRRCLCFSGKLYSAINDSGRLWSIRIARTILSFSAFSMPLNTRLTHPSKEWSECAFSFCRQWVLSPTLERAWIRNSKLKILYHKTFIFQTSEALTQITWLWYVHPYVPSLGLAADASSLSIP